MHSKKIHRAYEFMDQIQIIDKLYKYLRIINSKYSAALPPLQTRCYRILCSQNVVNMSEFAPSIKMK